MSGSDLTCVYYSALEIPHNFNKAMWRNLRKVKGDIPIIVKNKPPEVERSHINIYRQALEGAKEAKTKYVAFIEDDVLYSPEHFKHYPSKGKFAYNMNFWNLATWNPVFTQKSGGRRNLSQLICERKLFIEAMEERFAKYPEGSDPAIWAEPSKYEKNLGVTIREAEYFHTNPPNIVFSHETALSYQNLGTRKRLGEIRAERIPYWGESSELVKLYK